MDPFEYVKDPRWKSLDVKDRDKLIDLGFKRDIEADARWGEAPAEKQQQMRESYREKALSFDNSRLGAGGARRARVAPEVETPDPEDKSVVGEFVSGVRMGARGVAQGFLGTRAMFTGEEKREQLLEKYDDLSRRSHEDMISVPEFTEILERDEEGKVQVGKSAGRAGRWAVGQTGALIPIVGSIMAGGVIGAKTGAMLGPKGAALGAVIGAGRVAAPLAKFAAKHGAKKIGGLLGSMIGSFSAGYVLYAGSLYGDITAQGGEHGESKRAALIYGVPASAVSIVMPMAATAAVMGYLGKDFVRRRVKAILAGSALGAPAEGLAEFVAEGFVIAGEESVLGETMTKEQKRARQINAGMAGMLMGTVTGGVSRGGRPQGDVNTIVEAFLTEMEHQADNPAIRQFLINRMEAADGLTADQQGLLNYLKTEQTNTSRPINRELRRVQKMAADVVGRGEQANMQRAVELAAKAQAGQLTGDEALEFTAIVANSKPDVLAGIDARIANLETTAKASPAAAKKLADMIATRNKLAKESAEVFEQGEMTPAMARAEVAADDRAAQYEQEEETALFEQYANDWLGLAETAKQRDLERAFLPAIAEMEADLDRHQRGQGARIPWFTRQAIKDFDQANGTSYDGKVNAVTIRAAMERIKNDLPLSKSQELAWEYIQGAASARDKAGRQARAKQGELGRAQAAYEGYDPSAPSKEGGKWSHVAKADAETAAAEADSTPPGDSIPGPPPGADAPGGSSKTGDTGDTGDTAFLGEDGYHVLDELLPEGALRGTRKGEGSEYQTPLMTERELDALKKEAEKRGFSLTSTTGGPDGKQSATFVLTTEFKGKAAPAAPDPAVGQYVRSGSATGKVVSVKENGDYVLEGGLVVSPGKAPNWAMQEEPFTVSSTGKGEKGERKKAAPPDDVSSDKIDTPKEPGGETTGHPFDDFATRKHFDEWLARTVPEEEAETVRAQITALLEEHPGLVEEGKSWPELRRMAEVAYAEGPVDGGSGPVEGHPGLFYKITRTEEALRDRGEYTATITKPGHDEVFPVPAYGDTPAAALERAVAKLKKPAGEGETAGTGGSSTPTSSPIYEAIRQLEPGELQAAWTDAVEKGDTFVLKGKTYTVTINTPKTLTVKPDDGQAITLKRREALGGGFMAEGAGANFFRDVESAISVDLINEHNKLHTPSDLFNLTVKALQKAEAADSVTPTDSVTPMDGWQENLIKARDYANKLGLTHTGKPLDALVAMIDAHLAKTTKEPVGESGETPTAGRAAEELAAMSDEDIAGLIDEVANEVGITKEKKPAGPNLAQRLKDAEPFKTILTSTDEAMFISKAKKILEGEGIPAWKIKDAIDQAKKKKSRSGGATVLYINGNDILRELSSAGDMPRPTIAKPAKEAVEGLDELMKGVAAAFGVDPNKLLTFPPHLDRNAYSKARPHFMAAWEKFNAAGKSLKEYVRYLMDTFGNLIPDFNEYLGYLAKELQGKEDFTTEGKADSGSDKTDSVSGDDTKTPDSTGKGEKGERKKRRSQEEIDAEKEAKAKAAEERKKAQEEKKKEEAAKKKAAEEKLAKKAALGDFQNVGYVYDPEHLRKKTEGKTPKSAVKAILDAMLPSKIWNNATLADQATPGATRVKERLKEFFMPFREYVINFRMGGKPYYRADQGQSDIARIESTYGESAETIAKLAEIADDYMAIVGSALTGITGQSNIVNIVGRVRDAFFPGVLKEDGTAKYESYHELPAEMKLFGGWRGVRSAMRPRHLYDFLVSGWPDYLSEENVTLLSEIDPHNRPRNPEVIRDGLPDYGVVLTDSESFQGPFGFKGVGFGETSWIDQAERHRVVNAAYNAFRDMAAIIGANPKGMSLGGQLAVQFANLGHLAKGAAAAYFPTQQTINFTRDHGDGTLAHEWAHALDALANRVKPEIDQIRDAMKFIYDFDAGRRLADDLLAKDSPVLKRIINSKKQSRIEAVKEFIREKFETTVKKPTQYYQTALQIDPGYTANNSEMWARAWEAFIYDNLGGRNNYLVGDFVGEGRIGGQAGMSSRLVYPAGQEREHINGLLRHFTEGLDWGEDGKPHLKDDYVLIEDQNAARVEEELNKLLDEIEARYNAIWNSEPSADGNYWYSYNDTAFGPMMQPAGYVGYDKAFKGEEQNGTGAVAFDRQLHPDEILDFGLTNIQYEGEGATIIPPGDKGVTDATRDDGETALGKDEAEGNRADEEAGDVRPGDEGESGTGDQGGGRDGRPGRPPSDGDGDSGGGVHSDTAGNYVITDDSLTDPKGSDERFINNLAALRVLRVLEEEGRQATKDEKHILARYSGWGGLGEAFSHSPTGAWVQRERLLRDILQRDDFYTAAQSSPSSYYTPVPVARFMWGLAERLGFQRGQVLDPATGASGMFMGTMPKALSLGVTLHAVEKDSISARIAAKLYEKAGIEEAGFQDVRKPRNRFDLTMTNVPFEAGVTPADTTHNKGRHNLHNYFINKMLDLTAPGALSIAITSSATMDKAGKHLAEYAKKADLVGAIRLPSGIYSATNVVTDILVFRKKIEGSEYKGVPEAEWTTTAKDEATGLEVNQYFIKHPDMVAGKMEATTGRFGNEALRVITTEGLQSVLERIGGLFPRNIVEREITKKELTLDEMIPAPGTIKEGGLYLTEKGAVAWKIDGQEVLLPDKTPKEKTAIKVVKGYLGLLDQVRAVLRLQRTGENSKAAQAELNKRYKAFVKQHGPVNTQKNAEIFMDDPDASWVMALEEYDYDSKKVTSLADIFTKQVTGVPEKATSAATDLDALALALDEFGFPNLEYMAKLRGSDVDTVLAGVTDHIIENPETGFYETMDEYLSGQVRAKLLLAREMAESHPEYQRNVELLESVQPDEIPPHRITARIGAPWVSPDHLADYVKDRLDMRGDLTPVFSLNPATNEWKMTFRGRHNWGKDREVQADTTRALDKYRRSVEATRVWGTSRMNFLTLMEHAVKGKRPVVTVRMEDGSKYLDPVATRGAEAKLKEIQEDFGRWLFEENARAEAATARFNQLINVSVKPKADGSHLTFPGKSLWMLTQAEAKTLGLKEKHLVLYPHQGNAVWKYIRHGNIYLAHEVGSGKTATMALIAMEARRLLGKKKVLYVTLNDSTMGQAVAEIKRLYPLANVMPVMVSLETERQRRQLQKMALNDFDVAVMRQQDLDRIALSPEAQRVFDEQDLQELREAMHLAKAEGSKLTERDIQTKINALEEKLKNTAHADAQSRNIFFDEIGIDLMIVDEAHSYKNVPYTTTLSGVTGLNPSGSKVAQGFFRKTQYLNAQYPKGDSIVLASGTPLTNSIAELYNIQKFLQPTVLKNQGMWSFDRWIATYGDIGAQLEWDATKDSHKNIITNRRIVNAGRLLATAFQNVDPVLAEDTPIVRPEIRGGKPETITVPRNQYVEEYSQIVRERALAIEQDAREAAYEGRPDNLLRIYSNYSMVAIDQRLLTSKVRTGEVDRNGRPKYRTIPGPYADTPMQEDSKIYRASRKIYERWQAEKKHKGVQLVFADMGIPKRFIKFKEKTEEQLAKLSVAKLDEYNEAKLEADGAAEGAFNTYDGLKDELVKLGIPASQIAFIHDADHTNKAKKAANLRALFRKVRAGEVRVMIGSTSKAGTGVNVQDRVSDVHHLDIWWNFSAWVQRNGRALRAGNIYTDLGGVGVYPYVTRPSIDATRWDKVFSKGKQLNAALSGDINIDIIEDIGPETMSAKQTAAEASGDPMMARLATLIQEVQGLRYERSSFLDTIRAARYELAEIPGQIAAANARLARNEKTAAIIEGVTAVKFAGDEKVYVLAKDSKEINAALERAIKKDFKPWDENSEAPLGVLGTFTETEVTKADKKVKERKFSPVPARLSLVGAWGEPALRGLRISGHGLSQAIKSLAAVDAKKKTVDLHAGLSRSVTEFATSERKEAATVKEDIEALQGKQPKLEAVVKTSFAKSDRLAEAEAELLELETKLASSDKGDPTKGLPLDKYEAPVTAMDDIAKRSNWNRSSQSQILYDDNGTFFINKAPDTLKALFVETRKKFDPEGRYRGAGTDVADAMKTPGAQPSGPLAFTTIDGVTRFWVQPNSYIKPEAWGLAKRIVAPGGKWVRSVWRDTYGTATELMVHVPKDATEGDVAIVVSQSQEQAPEGVLVLMRGKPSMGAAAVSTGRTPAQTRTEIAAKLGKAGTAKLEKLGKLEIVKAWSDLPAGLRRKGVRGGYLNGKVWLVADAIAAGDAWNVMLHEGGGHLLLAEDKQFGPKKAAILQEFGKLQTENAKAARARVPKDTPAQHRAEEALGYFLESNPQHSLTKRLIAAVKMWLFRHGIPIKNFTEADFVALATQGFKAHVRELGETQAPAEPSPAMLSIQQAAKAIYSKLEQVAAASFQGMKAQGVKNFLSKQGVKKAEMDAVGIDAYLADKKPTDKVTQQELNDYIQANMVEVEDVVLGERGGINLADFEVLEATDAEGSAALKMQLSDIAEFTGYSYDGGKSFDLFDGSDYVASKPEADARRWLAEKITAELPQYLTNKERGETHFKQYQEPGAVEGSYREMFVTAPDHTKARVQQINDEYDAIMKKHGVTVQELPPEARSRIDQLTKTHDSIAGKTAPDWQDGHTQYDSIKNPIVRIRFNEVEADGKRLLRIEEMQGPNPTNQARMPGYLKDNIYQLGIKRIIAYAKENGFDGVAFATKPEMSAGETQAARYDLSKQVDEIRWRPDEQSLSALSDGKEVLFQEGVTEAKLPEVVGKAAAEKLLATPASEEVAGDEVFSTKSISGDDLKIGGEGLKQLYDHTLPKMLEAYGKGKMETAKAAGAESRQELVEKVYGRGEKYGALPKESRDRIDSMMDSRQATMPYLPITPETPASFPLFAMGVDPQIQQAAKAIFSKLEQVAAAFFQGMKAQGVKNFLSKQGVKKAEMDAVVLDAFLADKKPTDKVTQQELNDYIQANMVEVEDVMLGEPGAEPLNPMEARELLHLNAMRRAGAFTMPGQEARYNELYQRMQAEDEARAETHFSQYTEPGAVEGSYRELFVTAKGTGDRRAPNQIARAKFGKGFYDLTVDEQAQIADSMRWGTTWKDGHTPYSEIKNPVVRIRFNEVEADGKRLLRIEEVQGPKKRDQRNMPGYLKGNLYQIGIKRIIAYAKENGFDGVAFATKPGMTAGETQAARYDLSQRIGEIEYSESGHLRAYDLAGNMVDADTDVQIYQLPGYIGEDVAAKLMAQPAEGALRGSPVRTLSGLDLALGGEGLKQLYDHTLPKMLEAYGKGKMETASVVVALKGETTGLPVAITEDGFRGGWTVNQGAEVWNFPTEAKAEEFAGKLRAEVRPTAAMPFMPITPETPGSFPLFSFAGAEAATADQFALENAEARIKAGENTETVRQETGWHKGADGMWRFEIDDSNASFKGVEVEGGTVIEANYLGALLDHPALFAAYPAAADILVNLYVSPRAKVSGVFTTEVPATEQYFGREPEIKIKSPDLDQALSTLLHETQHFIQHQEGFATGGSPDAIGQNTAETVRNERMAPIAQDYRAAKAAFEENPTEANKKAFKELEREYLQAEGLPQESDRMEAYQRLAGEVESRNTQGRRKMTAGQRRLTPPSITADRSDVIITWNGEEMFSQEKPTDPARDYAAGLEVNEDLRIDPVSRSLMKGVGFFESASDRLRRSKSPILHKLAEAVDQFFNQAEARLGWINGRVRPALRKTKKADIEAFKDYWKHQDNGRAAEAEAVLAKHPRLRPLVENVVDLFDEIGTINQNVVSPDGIVGMQVADGAMVTQAGAMIGRVQVRNGVEVVVDRGRVVGTLAALQKELGGVKVGGWRRIGKVPRGKFWPRVLRPEVVKAMQNPANAPKAWNEMVEALINEGHINDWSEAQSFIHSYFSDESANDYFAGIEKARGAKLPETFYDYSWDVFLRYSRKWSSRISQVEQFGQAHAGRPDLFEQAIKKTLDRPTQTYLNEISNRVYDRKSTDVYTRILENLNLLATAIQLGNPATATLNLVGGTTLNVMMFGAKRVAQAYKILTTEWAKVQQEGVELGILGKDVLNIMRDTESQASAYFTPGDQVKDGLRKFASATMKWGGYKGTENIIRATAFIAARLRLSEALNHWSKRPGSAIARKHELFMRRNRIDPEKLILEGGKGEETARYLRLMVNIPQGSYRIDQVPIYVDTPVGRFLFKYQKFTTQVSRMFWQQHLNPFMSAETSADRARAFTALAHYFLTAFVGGTAILVARATLFGLNDPGPDFDELEKALSSEDTQYKWGLIFSRAYQSIMAASAFGFFGNYIKFSMDVADQQRAKNPLDPPGLASIDAVIELGRRWLEQGTITGRDLDQIGTQSIAFYRSYKRMGATAIETVGVDLREAKLDTARRDVAYTRETARRYADLSGVAARRTSRGRIGRTERSPLNQQVYEALVLGEKERARLLVRQAIRDAAPIDKPKLRASLMASARARQPIQIGGPPSQLETRQFLIWAKKELPPAKYQRILETQRNFEATARYAGLMR